MRLFSGIAFFTVSRSSDDSSPNTIRPLHCRTRIPSTVLLVIFNCMDNAPFAPAEALIAAGSVDDGQAYRVPRTFASPESQLSAISTQRSAVSQEQSGALLRDLCGISPRTLRF